MPPAVCFSIDHVFRYFAGTLAEPDLDQIDQHIQVCLRCRRLIDEAAKHGQLDSDEGPRSITATIASLPAGSLIAGRYAIDRFIASGGMGEVYQASDKLINEVVALKTVRSALRGDRG